MSSSPEFQDGSPVPVDRSERRAVALRGYIILADGTHHEVHLLDLSYEGCGIETAVALAPGDQVKLSVLRRGAIDAEVRWVEEGKAGLVFAPPAEPREHWPRRSDRIALSAEVVLRRVGRSSFRVAVADLSPEGCKVELVERPSDGERVLVKFDGLEPLEAWVRWVDGFTAGLSFRRPVHPAVFDLLIERLTA